MRSPVYPLMRPAQINPEQAAFAAISKRPRTKLTQKPDKEFHVTATSGRPNSDNFRGSGEKSHFSPKYEGIRLWTCCAPPTRYSPPVAPVTGAYDSAS